MVHLVMQVAKAFTELNVLLGNSKLLGQSHMIHTIGSLLEPLSRFDSRSRLDLNEML